MPLGFKFTHTRLLASPTLRVLQVALGPGGLQGPFSAAAADVLARLRSSADLLCGLLQLLLSDTAVDWSVDREAHAARKDQDTAVGLRLCASRCVETHTALLQAGCSYLYLAQGVWWCVGPSFGAQQKCWKRLF